MAWAPIAVAAAGTAYKIYSEKKGASKQAEALELQGEYQKEMFMRNAKFAGQNADDAIARGDIVSQDLRNQTKRLIGSQRAAMAAQGIDIESGSALQIQADTKYMSELDVAKIKANAIREAYGYKMEAQVNKEQAGWALKGAQTNAQNTLIASRNNQYTSLFEGVSKAVSSYYGAGG